MRTMQMLGIIPTTLLLGISIAMAQTSPPLPSTLAGQYLWRSASGHRMKSIPVELTSIVVDGENVQGVVSQYSSPAANCISENTPFKGTYKDGSLRIKSAPLKSQFSDGRPCGGVAMELKLDGRRASGTIGGEAYPLDLEAK